MSALPELFSVGQMLRAIRGSGGIPQVVASRLGCDRQTVINYLRRYPELNSAFLQERDAAVDIAEAQVFKAIQGDPENGIAPDIPTARWLLEQIGSPRGYGKHSRLDIVALNLDRLSDAQLDRIARGEDPIRVTLESIAAASNPAAITVDGDFREAPEGEEWANSLSTEVVSDGVSE